MRSLLLTVLALAALATAALGADRARRAAPEPGAAISVDASGPLFVLTGLRHGDRAERCVTVTNEGPDGARVAVVGEPAAGALAEHLRLVVTRGCEAGAVLWSGRAHELAAARDAEPLRSGEQRRFGLAVEVAGPDAEVQGRRAVQAFAFEAHATGEAASAASSGAPACRTITFSPRAGRRQRSVLIKRHRVDRRVTAKLILRIHGAPGRQRLVLVTGLRVGRRVLPGRTFGRVGYRVGRGATVVSRERPFRVRIAPGALRPGRNVVRVTVVPRGRPAVRARYVLAIAGRDACEIA